MVAVLGLCTSTEEVKQPSPSPMDISVGEELEVLKGIFSQSDNTQVEPMDEGTPVKSRRKNQMGKIE